MKPGYKQTEIGVIPEDWEMISLGEIASVKTGPFGSALHAEDYVQSGTPIITVEHLGESCISRQNLPLVSDEDKKRLSAYALHTGDIVFSRVGSVDRNAYVTEAEDGWLFSGRLLRIRVSDTRCISKYLSFFFKDTRIKSKVREIAVGQTMPSLNTKLLSSFSVCLPQLSDQRRISEALSDMDELIFSLEKLIEKKKAIKQGAMQELLTGKRRLPGFSGEWKTSPLITLCDSITDGSHESPLETDCGYYMPSVKDMTDCGFNYSACKQISKLDYEKLVRNGCQPVVGDVLIAKDGSILKHAFVYEQSVPTVILSSIAIIRPNKAIIDSQYLAQYFRQKSFVENVILNYKSGTGVPRIVLNNFKIIEIFHPISVKEQIAISETLGYIDVDIEMQEKKVEKARQIKQGMLQQLLTGKIRLA